MDFYIKQPQNRHDCIEESRGYPKITENWRRSVIHEDRDDLKYRCDEKIKLERVLAVSKYKGEERQYNFYTPWILRNGLVQDLVLFLWCIIARKLIKLNRLRLYIL